METMRSNNQIQLQLITSKNFYKTLVKLKIKKNDREVPNLSNFLRFNKESTDHIILKKLVKVIEEFVRNNYLQSFGFE